MYTCSIYAPWLTCIILFDQTTLARLPCYALLRYMARSSMLLENIVAGSLSYVALSVAVWLAVARLLYLELDGSLRSICSISFQGSLPLIARYHLQVRWDLHDPLCLEAH